MAHSVTKAQSHDEGRGGRSVTGVYGECNRDVEQKCNSGHGETNGHRSVMGEWLHGLRQCMVYSLHGMGM